TARGLQRLCSKHGLTHDGVASRIGKSRTYVTNYLRILTLAQPLQALLDAGTLTLGHAKVLAAADQATQITLARRAARHGLSVRALERLLHRHTSSDAGAGHADA